MNAVDGNVEVLIFLHSELLSVVVEFVIFDAKPKEKKIISSQL